MVIINNKTNLSKYFVPLAFYQIEKPFGEENKDQWYLNHLPQQTKEGIVFEAIKNEKYGKPYAVHIIRSISTKLKKQFPDYLKDAEAIDYGLGTYTAKVKLQRIRGTWDCLFWLINQENDAKPEIDCVEWYVRKRKLWGMSIPWTTISYFNLALHRKGEKQINKRVVISKKYFEESVIFSICLNLFENKILFWVNEVCKLSVYGINYKGVKFDLILNAGVYNQREKDKSHKCILEEFRYEGG